MSNKSGRKRHKSISKNKLIVYIKIATVLGAILLTAFLGIMIPKSMNKSDSSIEMTKEYTPGEDISSSLKKNEEVENLIDDETPKTEILISHKNDDSSTKESNVEEKSEVDSNSNDNINQKETEEVEAIDESKKTTIEENNNTVSDNLTETKTETALDGQNLEDTSSNQADAEALTEKEELSELPEGMTEDEQIQYVKDQWVDDMIQENKDSIDELDLKAGAAIYNQLDTQYLFGLAEDGLTEEEKAEALAYLEANLAPDQLELALALFDKYIGLVN